MAGSQRGSTLGSAPQTVVVAARHMSNDLERKNLRDKRF
uniref:Uncharacterized protein n=1 Tax=Anguilla anguilla TaxID=7936 RepID=A0A0E9SYC7_ANGAN